jgi:hypothetical protein
MTLPITLLLMLATAGLFALAAWRSGRPSNPLKPRLIPWTLLSIASGVFFMMLLAHVFSHFGFVTGQRFMPR